MALGRKARLGFLPHVAARSPGGTSRARPEEHAMSEGAIELSQVTKTYLLRLRQWRAASGGETTP